MKFPKLGGFGSCFVAACCAALSATMTVDACLVMNSSWVMIGIGVVWEIAKVIFCKRGAQLFTEGRPIGGACVLAVCVILMLGSICASFQYISSEMASNESQRRITDDNISDLRTRIASIDGDIGILQTIATRDAEEHYRRRSITSLERISHLRDERFAFASKLASAQSISHSLPVDAFASASQALHLPDSVASALHLWAAIVVAVMLEIIGVVAIMLVRFGSKCPGNKGDANPNAEMQNDSPVDAKSDATTHSAPGVHLHILPPPVDSDPPDASHSPVSGIKDRIEDAKMAVLKGDVEPSYRALQKVLGIGQKTAQRVLSELAESGTVIREGRKFVLREQMIR